MSFAHGKRLGALDARQTQPRTLARARDALLRPSPTRLALRALSLALFIVLWQLASASRLNLGVVTFANVPAPTEVLDSALILARSGKLIPHLAASVIRVLSGFGVATLFGVGIGIAVARAKFAEDGFMPLLEILRPIPAVAWIPLAILMFPSAEGSMVFITFTGALFPILLNTIHGVTEIDRRLIASAQSLGATRRAILFEVILPGAAPAIVTGLAIGMGTSWFCLVTAEMISGQYGVGYYTWEAYTLQNYADIIVGMATIGLLGMISSFLVRKIGAALTPWSKPR